MKRIGIRREDKNRWERRVLLLPEHVKELKEITEVWLQPSEIRIFSDKEYIQTGAVIQEDLSPCPIIFAIKEIPIGFFEPNKTYAFFSHTIKGQSHNMPMLRRMMELKCQLIDYEKVVDDKGRRLIFFGKYAGLAGMIDTLWALGERLDYEGTFRNPFSGIRKAHKYESLQEAKEDIANVGKKISTLGLPKSLTPFICGFIGYGNVYRGAQEILDLLPTRGIEPKEISEVSPDANIIYKVVFREEHIVELKSKIQNLKSKFNLQDYYDHPEKYLSIFESYIPYLTLLVNCVYWDLKYPRFVTKKYLRQLFSQSGTPRLRVIGDISCDVEGAIECTVHPTDLDNPVFVYNPLTEQATPGVKGVGPVVLAVDNLPCELPRESSIYFSGVLKNFIPQIVNADFSVVFEHCNLPREIKDAIILYHGKLTPNYKYIEKFL